MLNGRRLLSLGAEAGDSMRSPLAGSTANANRGECQHPHTTAATTARMEIVP